MSGWYWLMWAVLTSINAALWLWSWRNLKSTLVFLAECREHNDNARRLVVDAKGHLDAASRLRGGDLP